MKASEVITMGRKRRRAASIAASKADLPSRCCSAANSTIRTAFLAARKSTRTGVGGPPHSPKLRSRSMQLRDIQARHRMGQKTFTSKLSNMQGAHAKRPGAFGRASKLSTQGGAALGGAASLIGLALSLNGPRG